ncbi:hypothetical protein BC830DRAFT_1175094 [Chytriomyces sp. MP71]|nr:hypothetical protein BC830DRAFT_1175094 [Chytriomyces sp. MP71]
MLLKFESYGLPYSFEYQAPNPMDQQRNSFDPAAQFLMDCLTFPDQDNSWLPYIQLDNSIMSSASIELIPSLLQDLFAPQWPNFPKEKVQYASPRPTLILSSTEASDPITYPPLHQIATPDPVSPPTEPQTSLSFDALRDLDECFSTRTVNCSDSADQEDTAILPPPTLTSGQAGYHHKQTTRYRFSRDRMLHLKQMFRNNPTPSQEEMLKLSSDWDVDFRKIKIFFQNMRTTTKKREEAALRKKTTSLAKRVEKSK